MPTTTMDIPTSIEACNVFILPSTICFVLIKKRLVGGLYKSIQ